MFIRIGFEIEIDCAQPTTLILALSPHSDYVGARFGSDQVHASGVELQTFVDPFDNRLTRLRAPAGRLTFWSDCIVENDGQPDPYDWNARQHEVADLPPETLPFLTPSRYCDSDVLAPEAMRIFGQTEPGWARVQEICNFVQVHLTFGYGFGRSSKTASDAMREKTGVCRDFAHLAIALCRAMNIPARYASGYLGDIGAPFSGAGDFSAWFEAYLDGRWHTFDARHNTPRIGRVLMVRGRDAADGAMITSFGAYDLMKFKVWTDEVSDTTSEAAMLSLLESRPDVEGVVLAPTVNP